ncbi:MAG: hypothetical protein RL693_2427 [Verrucomicrobiota bacterium]|jgi:hypothetical protein
MKARVTLYLSIGFFLAAAVLFYAAIKISLPGSTTAKAATLIELAIQTADSIEVSQLSDVDSHPAAPRYSTKLSPEEYAITSTQQLTADQTKELLTILKRHAFSTSGGAACHTPGFVLRFSRHGRTLLECSLCLHCFNMEMEPFPFTPLWVSMFENDAKTVGLPELERFFSKLKTPTP